MTEKISTIIEHIYDRLSGAVTDNVLLISIPEQTLELWSREKFIAMYSISTALKGPGNEMNSLKTPLGIHRIAEKIGAGCEVGTIFKGRRATGEVLADFTQKTANEDLITSRILWLDGLEEGINRGGDVDSKQRYIYIHGTHAEDTIGQAVSHGCIRMKNADVIELFERVLINDLVYISDHALVQKPRA